MSNKETPQQAQEPENFLGRWARLKQQNTQLAESTDKPGFDSSQPSGNASEPLPERSGRAEEIAETEVTEATAEKPLLTDADMPPLETLDEKSDYSGFFSSGVSEELRKLALRKLFHTPTFNIRDGLDDYDADYTQFAALGDIITTDMKHQMKVEARRALEKLEKETRSQPAPATDSVEEIAEETADAAPVEAVDTGTEVDTAAPTTLGTEQAGSEPLHNTPISEIIEITEEKPA